MKDLDFDELDRAVNSLITSAPGSSSSGVNSTAPLGQQPIDGQPVTSVTIPPSSALAIEKPSTGRFMDVVHPSSDMRTSPSLVMPERTSVQTIATPTPTVSPIPAPAPAPVLTPIPTPTTLPTQFDQPATGFPTISNRSSSIDPSVTDDSVTDEDDDIDRISNDINNTISRSSDESADSPFLTGTKVEKRPLGAFSAESVTAPVTAPIPTPAIPISNSTPTTPASAEAAPYMPVFWPTMSGSQPTEVNASPNAAMPKVDEPLPDELQKDLLSIESDTTVRPEKPVVTNIPSVSNIPYVSKTPTTPIAPDLKTTPAPLTATVAATTSIPQQYKEQPSSGDKSSGAIFDTKSYHKAMVRPTKKKSSWTLIIWMVVLLVVGVGAGVAVYFFVLPRL